MSSPLLPPSIKTLSIVHYHSTHTTLLSNLISNKSLTKSKKPKLLPLLLHKNNHHTNKSPNPYSKPPRKNQGHHQPKNHTKKNHPLLKKITLQEYLEFLVKFLAVKNNKNLKHTKWYFLKNKPKQFMIQWKRSGFLRVSKSNLRNRFQNLLQRKRFRLLKLLLKVYRSK